MGCGDGYLNCETDENLGQISNLFHDQILANSSKKNIVLPELTMKEYEQINVDETTRSCKYIFDVKVGETEGLKITANSVIKKIDRGTRTHNITTVFDPMLLRGLTIKSVKETKLKEFKDEATAAGFNSVEEYRQHIADQKRIKRDKRVKYNLAAALKAKEERKNLIRATDYTFDTLNEKGETVYLRHCSACHQPTGKGLPPAFPALDGNTFVLGKVIDVVEVIKNGRFGTGMQPYKSQLGDDEIASVAVYIRNAWSNSAKEFVQPIDIPKLIK